MPKMKTHKSVVKRFRITKKKKFVKRTCGQDHFNARERGKTTVAKRRDKTIAETEIKSLRRFVPYFKH